MIDTILNVILGLLLLAILYQPTAARMYAAALFVISAVAFDAYSVPLTGIEYYGSAAAVDLLVMILLMGVNPLTRTILTLQAVALLSIFLNIFGWVMWKMYQPPELYNAAFLVLYTVALIVLLMKDKRDVGGFDVDKWGACFSFHSHPCSKHINSYLGKI